jgi:alanine racemase
MADGFAVAFVEEALALRTGGIANPILVLEGAFVPSELKEARAHGLWMAVHDEAQLRMIELDPDPRLLNVWLKADSGMRRAGFVLADMLAIHARLLSSGKVAKITLMTHFARADELESPATARQIAAFDAATTCLAGERSLCNSAGLLGWASARKDWARPGILLYGADPMPGEASGLRPVMTLQSQVFVVRSLMLGDELGYGGTFVANKPTRIGLVAIGYADGYPRAAPMGTPVGVDGRLSRTVGRVSMDMLTIDLSDLPEAGVGSTVELWGSQISVNTVASCVGTVAYELLCNVKRVPLVYSAISPASCH